MIPAQFAYHRPASLDEALKLLTDLPDAKLLAGGHSLLPAMKLRLAQPQSLIDLGRIPGLNGIRQDGARLRIGALATHFDLENSELLKDKCPLLPEVAASIGDAQVRNRGTIGGSIVHADPAADWPAAIVALDAEMELAGPRGRRSIAAANFFVEMMQSAVQPDEVLVEIRVPVTGTSVAYIKSVQQASGFAVVGVAAVVNEDALTVALGITGAAAKAFRAAAAEAALNGHPLSPERIESAARSADEGVETLNDIHASAGYRSHLIRVNTRRALELAVSRT